VIVDLRLDRFPMNWASQVVIVGTGPAGLTLARELASIAQVLLIEAGDVGADPAQEDLLTGECAGIPYPLTATRARQFGGSSSLWAGYCAQFDAHDFAVRDWVPLSGWPFGIETIEPYYSRVAELLNLGDADFDAGRVAQRAGASMPFHGDAVAPAVWRFGTPTQRFGDSLLPGFATSDRTTTLTNATVVDVRVDAGGSSVTELVIRTLNGREGRVRADLFILACGGIETARLLLHADSQLPGGVGNSSGMVGRCFMEHPHRCIVPLLIERPALFDSWTRRVEFEEDRQFTFCMGLSRQAQESARVMNARAHIYRTPEMRDDETPRVGLFLEQAPNPESRVLLSQTADALGMRRVRLDWRLSELDWTTYRRTAEGIAAAFERIGAARLTAPIAKTPRSDNAVLHSNHHLGTTRMSASRHDGVVDANCRAHDISNLYVMGGSIFPTVSWANPTFTLLALTLRLAEHLKTNLGYSYAAGAAARCTEL
jgi:choline dehydrogenase-like flavoprotein